MKKILGMLGTLALLAGTAYAEKIAYLGVATVPVEPVAAYQLNLPDGVGLAVMEIAEDGVVKGKLEEHDILQKLDDQILTSPEQLAVLVRSHKPGDTVRLTTLRKGKEEVFKVTLGETDARRIARHQRGFGGGMMTMPPMPGADPDQFMQQWPHQWHQWQQQMPQNPDDSQNPTPRRSPRVESHAETHSSSIVTETRDGLTVTLTERDGQKTVRAEEDGKVIVDDMPANTEKELKALPDKVRDRLADMKKNLKINTPSAPRPGSHRQDNEI